MHVTARNSNLWYSEFSRPKLVANGLEKSMFNEDPDYPTPVVTWEDDPDFMRTFVPPLAVYHIKYAEKINN